MRSSFHAARTIIWRLMTTVTLFTAATFVIAALPAQAARPPFVSTNGLLVVEAEHAAFTTPRSVTAWRTMSSSDAVGGQALAATPESGYFSTGTGATASYPITLERSGVYFMWVRSRAANSSHNSVGIGNDGNFGRLHLAPTGDWTWNNQLTNYQGRATRYLSSGDHTLMLGVSEGGAQIDRVLLTNDAEYTPSGNGPAESTQGESTNPVPPPTVPPRPTHPPQPTPAPPMPPVSTGTHQMGCRADEVFQDSQDWWSHADPARDFGHVHTQVCFPLMAHISQPRAIHITTALHANPGTLYRVDVQVFGSSPVHDMGCNDSYAIQCQSFKRTLKTCTATGDTLVDNGVTCRWTDTFVLDPRQIDGSGLQQFRFRSFVKEH